MKNFCIFCIKLYQVTPLHTHSLCRFTPTCSEYAKQAIEKFGVLKGCKLGIKKILKCHPGGKFGYDPLINEEKQ